MRYTFKTVRIPKKPFHNKKNKVRLLDSYRNSESFESIIECNISSEISLIWVREILKERNKK